jgi:hypothetical protein
MHARSVLGNGPEILLSDFGVRARRAFVSSHHACYVTAQCFTTSHSWVFGPMGAHCRNPIIPTRQNLTSRFLMPVLQFEIERLAERHDAVDVAAKFLPHS